MDINVNKILDDYKKSLGLPTEFLTSHNEILPFLNMSAKDIHKLSPEQAGEASILLNIFSLHLQLQFNREVAKHNWATQQAKKQVSAKLSNHYGSWEMQLINAINDDEYAKKLDELSTQSKLRIDELSYISNSIKSLSDALLQRSRYVRTQ